MKTKTGDGGAREPLQGRRFLVLGQFAVALLVGLVMFWGAFSTDSLLYPPVDGSPFFVRDHQQLSADLLVGGWFGEMLGYRSGAQPLYPMKLLEILLPPLVFHVSRYFVDTLLLFAAGLYLLRSMGFNGTAAFLPSLALAFSGYTFTLISAGHALYFDMMPFAVFVLALVHQAVCRLSVYHLTWAGLCGAFGMVTQPDVMGLFGLLAACYGLFLVIRKWREEPGVRRRLARVVVWGGLTASLAFGAVALSGRAFLARVAAGREEVRGQLPQEKWVFSTNWSLPPEETVEFVIPCIFGIETGDHRNPYWGRLGRSYGWDRHRTGLANYRQHTVYLGVIPLVFGVYAFVRVLFRCMKRSRTGRPTSDGDLSLSGNGAEVDAFLIPVVLFWGFVALGAWLLALGRYGFLYRLFFMLPLFSMIRCPVKFVHLIEVSLSVLFASGFLLFLRDVRAMSSRADGLTSKSESRCARSHIFWFGVLCGVVCLLLLVGAWLVDMFHPRLYDYWRNLGPQAMALGGAGLDSAMPVMLDGMKRALRHAASIFFLCAGVFVSTRWIASRRGVYAALVLILTIAVCTDVTLVNRRYIRTRSVRDIYGPNPVADRILDEGISRTWYQFDRRSLTWRFWFCGNLMHHGINLLPFSENMGTPERWAEDYRSFFGALSKDAARLWMLTNSRFIVGPRRELSPLLSNPAFEVVLPFDIGPGRVEERVGEGSQCVLVRFRAALPRSLLYYDWEHLSIEDSLSHLDKRDWDPRRTLLASGAVSFSPSNIPPSDVHIVSYGNNRVVIEVDAARDGIVLLNDRFDPDWVVRVDGKKQPLLRCNYIMRGVQVPAGKHTVVFTYYPYLTPFLISAGTCVLMLVWSLLRFIRNKRRQDGAENVPS